MLEHEFFFVIRLALYSFATASEYRMQSSYVKANGGGELQVGGQHIQGCKETRISEERLYLFVCLTIQFLPVFEK